jgi:hypothetical protein
MQFYRRSRVRANCCYVAKRERAIAFCTFYYFHHYIEHLCAHDNRRHFMTSLPIDNNRQSHGAHGIDGTGVRCVLRQLDAMAVWT